MNNPHIDPASLETLNTSLPSPDHVLPSEIAYILGQCGNVTLAVACGLNLEAPRITELRYKQDTDRVTIEFEAGPARCPSVRRRIRVERADGANALLVELRALWASYGRDAAEFPVSLAAPIDPSLLPDDEETDDAQETLVKPVMPREVSQ